MTDRPPFEAAHNCICAYPGTSILNFYKEYFDSVYIMLHPFYQANEQGEITKLFSWKEMVALTGFADINQLDVAMRNSIGGLVKRWENKADVDRLQSTCKQADLWIPSEGQFQDALRRGMLMSLQGMGHHYIYVADEWGYERKLDYIPTMIGGKDEVTLTWSCLRNWYTNYNELLYTTHWDSHFTLLCSDKATVESLLDKHPFEGFYCNELTKIYWGLQDD